MEEKSGDIKPKRVTFIATDVQLLLDCVKEQSNVLGSKKTNNITPALKKKVKNLHEL
jgi:hypothetical protein